MKQQLKVLNFTCMSNANNIGQRLQTYALQKFIGNNFNAIVYTADYRNATQSFFDRFELQYLNLHKEKEFNEDDYNMFDLIMYGSDQCIAWMKRDDLHARTLYYTDFFANRIPQVSYSASANGMLIDCKENDEKVNKLKQLKKISIREFQDGESLKKVLTKNDIDIHIDPTFLLTKEEWESICSRPSFIDENDVFDFQYTIGKGLSDIKLQDDGTKKYVFYGNVRQLGKFGIQPDEFLWMVKHCRNYSTNSFHGQVFGLMFKKDIPIPKNYRLNSLFKLLDAKIENGHILNVDEVDKNIEKQRYRAFNWFQECFYEIPLKYAVYTKQNRGKSTSGGLSALLSQNVISKGGVVYGAAYTDDFKSVHTICVDNMEDYFRKIAKSKYSECQMPDLNELKQRLDNGELVLFTGCPCQIKSLMKFLNKKYDNLITVDLLCNGYSRNEFLRKFVEEQEKNEKSKIVDIDMRYHHSHNIQVMFENGNKKYFSNVLMSVFICNKEKQLDECKTCNMHVHGNGVADLTIGDFWEYKKYNLSCDGLFDPFKGTSVVYANTEKGRQMMNEIKPNCDWRYLI